jgi:hypothetical protein
VAKTNETVGRIQHLLAVSKSQEQDRFARAPLPYPREFDFEIDRFVEAVRVVVSGDFKQAKEMVEAIDHEPMVNWYDEIAQHVGAEKRWQAKLGTDSDQAHCGPGRIPVRLL